MGFKKSGQVKNSTTTFQKLIMKPPNNIYTKKSC